MSNYLDYASDVIERALKKGATAADAVSISATDVQVVQRLGVPEDLERAESVAIGLRVFVGNKVANVSSSDFSNKTLDELSERAIAMANASTDDADAALAPEALLAGDINDLDLCDSKEPSVEWLQEQAAACEDAARNVKGITNSEGAEAGFSRYHVALATSHGFAKCYNATDYSISVSVLAGEGDAMERDYDYSSARFAADLDDAASIGKQAADNTLRRLNPRKVGSKQVPIIVDPRISAGLLGTFAKAINGSAIARGTSFLKDAMGKTIFNDSVQIIDDPHQKRGRSSKPYDGEGVVNKKHTLIEHGILQSWLLDMRSANQLGLQTTGHAARSVGGNPHPSSTNLYMKAGTATPEELIADVKDGLYLTEAFGMGVNIVTGDYSQGASGIWIENGKLTYPVSELTIAGHLSDMFAHMTPANDLAFKYSTNAPTLHIAQMTVAGS